MQVIYGDLFDYKDKGYLVIPVNIGWYEDGSYCAIMGKGVALQASRLDTDLKYWWGKVCSLLEDNTPTSIYPHDRFIHFPTKSLDRKHPQLSWKNKSALTLIEKSAKQLLAYNLQDKVYLPLVGCGEGGLDPYEVENLLKFKLTEDNYYLVKPLNVVDVFLQIKKETNGKLT